MADYGICAAPGCGKPAYTRKLGLCGMHAARLKRGGILERRVPKMAFDELLGGRRTFGDWTVIAEDRPSARRDNGAPVRRALCRCKCGVERSIPVQSLKSGHTTQCGCRKPEMNRSLRTTHGDASNSNRAPEYRSWAHMKDRCYNPNDKRYEDYGGRGITVCDKWRNNYEAFAQDMGRKPSPRHSIDRIDNDGNYEPGNCRWATPAEQRINQRPRRSNQP